MGDTHACLFHGCTLRAIEVGNQIGGVGVGVAVQTQAGTLAPEIVSKLKILLLELSLVTQLLKRNFLEIVLVTSY